MKMYLLTRMTKFLQYKMPCFSLFNMNTKNIAIMLNSHPKIKTSVYLIVRKQN